MIIGKAAQGAVIDIETGINRGGLYMASASAIFFFR